jgi:hypothetical protein
MKLRPIERSTRFVMVGDRFSGRLKVVVYELRTESKKVLRIDCDKAGSNRD